MDDDSVGWYHEFSLFSEAFQPAFICLELSGFCGRAGVYLYVTAPEQVCGDDFGRLSGVVLAQWSQQLNSTQFWLRIELS